MANRVRLRLDHGKLTATVGPMARSSARKAAGVSVRRVRANILADGLVDSGDMLAGVQQRDVPSPAMFPKVAVGSPAPHVKFPEFGTRAHGPVRASRLRFTPKGSGRVVYAKWVRGVRPRRFMRRALDAIRPTDFE